MSGKTATRSTVTLRNVSTHAVSEEIRVDLPDFGAEPMADVGAMTAMTLVLLGNYAQTGHYGGPLAYTPYNVAVHLGGPELGGLRWDIREPKHPYSDKFMLAGGHCIPTCYALWMVLYEAMLRQHAATGDDRFGFDPKRAILPIDALGFRRSQGVCDRLLQEQGLADDPLFAQAKLRGIRFLAGHAETTDVSNDVNGGPSGVGLATAAGKAMFWDAIGAPRSLKVIAFEGEFALVAGHAEELKTAALAQQVGKRLRLMMSFNNAGIDDRLLGGVIHERHEGYDIPSQWTSYGWNVFEVADGSDYAQLLAAMKTMEDWDESDGRPMVMVGHTLKGWWPDAKDGKIPGNGDQVVSYPSHPYSFKMNCEYFQALAATYERRYGVEFQGIRDGVPKTEAERLIQFKTNIDVALSVLDRKAGLREWIAERLVEIAGKLDRKLKVVIPTDVDPFRDPRLEPENLPVEPVEAVLENPHTGEKGKRTIELFAKPGEKRGTRKAISEIGKWMNYVTGNRFYTVAADLSSSINVENSSFFGHYDPVSNPAGTRLKAAITEAVNSATMCGLVGQNASTDPETFAGVWGISGTYGAFTPLMYLPARIHSQQNQDSPFPIGVLNILAGHSGPETAADARSHFGIFSPQVWTLFPRGQVCNLYFWDYNDVAPGYFAAVREAVRRKELGVIVIHVARPDFQVADRSGWADPDLRSAAKGCYLIRDWDPAQPRGGTVLVQGSSATANLVGLLDRLGSEGLNVRVVAVISEDLFSWQSRDYRESVLPLDQRYDCMFVTTMTKRVPPISNLGPLTEEYSLASDHDDRWRTGGLEPDVIEEAGLDPEAIFRGVRRFVEERESRLARQREAFGRLG
jgi:transketolase